MTNVGACSRKREYWLLIFPAAPQVNAFFDRLREQTPTFYLPHIFLERPGPGTG